MLQHPNANYLGALLNSLFQHDYAGTVWIGNTSSQLPFWTRQIRAISAEEFEVAPGFHVRFVQVTTAQPLLPSDFIELVLTESGAETIVYIAEDAVIEVDWAFFCEWADLGVALCADMPWDLQDSHPLVLAWRRIYQDRGMLQRNFHNGYMNDGFLALSAARKSFIHLWRDLNLEFINQAAEFQIASTTPNTRSISQLALNAAVEVTDQPISLLGPNGMAFAQGPRVMWRTAPHAMLAESHAHRFRSLNAARMHLKYSDQPLRISTGPEGFVRELDRWYGILTGRHKNQARS